MTQHFEFHSGFFGTGESFIFKVRQGKVKIFNNTFTNDLYCFADKDGFGMGSDNHFGLFIFKNLR